MLASGPRVARDDANGVKAPSPHLQGLARAFAAVIAFAVVAACSQSVSGPPAVPPPTPYCPYLPSRTFSPAVTISGGGFYQYRINGDGEIQDSGARFVPTVVGGATYSVTIAGLAYSYTAPLAGATKAGITAGLAAAINAATSTSGAKAVGTVADVRVSPVYPSAVLAMTNSGTLTKTAHAASNPIRYAEIRVTDPAGTLVQCAETDGTGAFAFQLPQNSGAYSVAVTPRSNNSSLQAYVLQNPNTNTNAQVAVTVGSSANATNVPLVALADGTLEGGAFNILDKLLVANTFLRAQTATSTVVFTVAPLIYVYWAPGVNPGSYFGQSAAVSFYLLGRRQLYLMGGVNGAINSVDVDHFDNSVIAHEYGHFIEDVYAHPDSTGGSHDGQSILDPRLAWGEGWADFFQAAALGSLNYTGAPYYRDTLGNLDCNLLDGQSAGCHGALFLENLETNAVNIYDTPSLAGEGNFHEFSISRVLWHALDAPTYYPAASTTHSTSRWSEIWNVFANSSYGFASAQHFRAAGLFEKIQKNQVGHADWSSIETTEKHRSDLTDYATPVTTGGAPCLQTIKPVPDGGTLASSDQFNNHDFYYIAHPGGALSASITCSANCGNDLDLYVWSEGFTMGKTDHLVAASATFSASNEAVSVSLPAGNYLVNVNIDTANPAVVYGSNTTYQLSLGGMNACPNP